MQSSDFSGGKITTIMGGNEIDFRECQLAHGTSVIDIACIMGGVEIYLPEHWKVVVEISPILGGIDDKRASIVEPEEEKILVLKGFCLFGGVEIRH